MKHKRFSEPVEEVCRWASANEHIAPSTVTGWRVRGEAPWYVHEIARLRARAERAETDVEILKAALDILRRP